MLPADAVVPVDDGEVPGPEGLHGNDTWPTPSGITLEMATDYCTAPIQSLSIYNTCAEYTAQTIQPIIDGCTLDIQVRLSIISARRKHAAKRPFSRRYASL